MMQSSSTPVSRQRATSVRIALSLAVVALASFGGVILAEYTRSPQIGAGVLGLALVAFLLVAMTRRERG